MSVVHGPHDNVHVLVGAEGQVCGVVYSRGCFCLMDGSSGEVQEITRLCGDNSKVTQRKLFFFIFYADNKIQCLKTSTVILTNVWLH